MINWKKSKRYKQVYSDLEFEVSPRWRWLRAGHKRWLQKVKSKKDEA